MFFVHVETAWEGSGVKFTVIRLPRKSFISLKCMLTFVPMLLFSHHSLREEYEIGYVITRYAKHRQSCTQWSLASMTLQGQQVHPPPSMPSPTQHIERSGANSPRVFTSKHVSVKAGRETYISRIVGGEVFLLCTRWHSKMFVLLDSSKRHT